MKVYSILETAELIAGASQVPDCSQIFEQLVSQTNASRLPTLAELVEFIRTLWDPWTCPVSELKLLAWAWSVDVFEDWWPEPRKRRTIAESRLYHARKTTTAGVRMALGYRDATLVRVNTPRMGFFADVPVSAADEARWRAGLPEIRIYDPAPVVLKRRPWGFAGVNLIARADARLARTAVLVRDGVEGLVVPPDDAEALARALARLAADPALIASLGEGARARILAGGFTEAAVAEAVCNLYRELMPA